MPRKRPAFSRPFNEALIKAEMINEMIAEDGWPSLEECLRRAPNALETFARHADAALRVIQRIDEREANLKPSEHDDFCN